jgi:hypothetical protein
MQAPGIADAATQRDALAGRLLDATLGLMELGAVYLGDRLGLYRALARRPGMTSAELAAEVGVHERYAREWRRGHFLSAASISSTRVNLTRGRPAALPRSTSSASSLSQSAHDTCRG